MTDPRHLVPESEVAIRTSIVAAVHLIAQPKKWQRQRLQVFLEVSIDRPLANFSARVDRDARRGAKVPHKSGLLGATALETHP